LTWLEDLAVAVNAVGAAQSVARHAERPSARAKAMSASSRRRSMVWAEHERNLNRAMTLPLRCLAKTFDLSQHVLAPHESARASTQ
jgi:hypothetical protein